jgi:hypothetical protein
MVVEPVPERFSLEIFISVSGYISMMLPSKSVISARELPADLMISPG